MVGTSSNVASSSVLMPVVNRRKLELLEHIESNVNEQEYWRAKNPSYYEEDRKFMRFLVPPGKRVLELGCGRGGLLAALDPAYGVGVDFSKTSIAVARERYP